MNPIVKILIASDAFIFFGLGLIGPIFAVFIINHLAGGSLSAAGTASAIYLVTKALFQLPVARFTDREPAQLREFWTLVVGYFMITLVPFFYLYITTVSGLYLAQFFYGLGSALAFPGWMSIFTKFADHEHAGFSWSAHNTTILLSTAAAGAIGGYIGEFYGFTPLFLGVGIMVFLGFFATIGLAVFYDDLRLVDLPKLRSFKERWHEVLKHKRRPLPPPHTPGQIIK